MDSSHEEDTMEITIEGSIPQEQMYPPGEQIPATQDHIALGLSLGYIGDGKKPDHGLGMIGFPITPSSGQKPMTRREVYNKRSSIKYSMWKDVGPLRAEVELLKAKGETDSVKIKLLEERIQHLEEKMRSDEERKQRMEDSIRMLLSITKMIQNPSECIKMAMAMANNILSPPSHQKEEGKNESGIPYS